MPKESIKEREEEEERARAAAYTLGKELNAKQVEWLEMSVDSKTNESAVEGQLDLEEKKSQDLISRLELLGYYQFQTDAEAPKNWFRHLLGIIENFPNQSGYVASILMNSSGKLSSEQFAQASALWQKMAQALPQPNVLGNAGAFLIWRDLKEANRLLEQAHLLEPDNVRWPSHLALFNYMTYKKTKDESTKLESAKMAVKYGEITLALGSHTPWLDLEHVGECALYLNDFEKAIKCAEELEKLNIHKAHAQTANALRGLVAARSEQIALAVAALHKLEEGYSINSMTFKLAEELFKLGEIEAIKDFVGIYQAKLGAKRHLEWLDILESGNLPDLSQADF
ncbi:MAG: hypothetical protein J0M35_19700 [Candidatus Obscuribacter phosphatis]|uniref:Tetratricopeptide repeat protein n=1 Tax=Candidatus Obscuribacter phosphatis TaxID=1906157 RepID=A0A8J7PIG7_9BACT|nr:hypothetical protein [Candidatus Obscuribacter phosphatis]